MNEWGASWAGDRKQDYTNDAVYLWNSFRMECVCAFEPLVEMEMCVYFQQTAKKHLHLNLGWTEGIFKNIVQENYSLDVIHVWKRRKQ